MYYPNIIKYLGEDNHGFKYFLSECNYVFQFYPNRKPNGWFCSGSAWERTLHKVATKDKPKKMCYSWCKDCANFGFGCAGLPVADTEDKNIRYDCWEKE